MQIQFRFQTLDIWKLGFQIANQLYDIADVLESKKLFRFAEQLRGAGLSITNNISEGSGSFSNKEFGQFINYSRRSIFECANILLTLEFRKYISEELCSQLLEKLEILSKKELAFKKSLDR